MDHAGLLPVNSCTHAKAAVAFSRAPYERPLRALILLVVGFLAVIDLLPFYVNLPGRMWDQLVDYEFPSDTPIGIEAAVLALVVVLVAVAGGRAQTHALRPCSVLLRPEFLVHAFNVLLLAGVIPWWTSLSEADVSDLFDGWGYISGAACKWMMGLCLIPIARESLWLNAAAAGFPEGIRFHRVTGWWCVAQVTIHAACYTLGAALDAVSDYEDWNQHGNQTGLSHAPRAPGEFDGTEWHAVSVAMQVYFWPWAARLNVETGDPEPNTTGVFILLGLLGTLAAIALAMFSLPRLRRARYDLFYVVHVPAAALFIVLGAAHDFQMMGFVVPGLVTYFLDRTDFLNRTASSRFHRVTARLRVMTADWVRLEVANNLGALTSDAAFGTQFVYLRVPALGGESHAFSLAARCPSIVIKANGDWTRRLHQLAEKQAADALLDTAAGRIQQVERNAIPTGRLSSITTDLVCEIDGVYGNASPPWRSYSHVLFVGGGVGVTPWLPAMEEHQEMCHLHGATGQTMRLVWCGRTHAELDAMGPYLPEDTAVFITRPAPTSAPAVSPRGACDDASDAVAVAEPGGVWASTIAAKDAVGRSGTTPWLFAFVGVASLALTQMSYYYIRGAHSVYVDYEEGCGEGCFEGEPTLTQYLLARTLPVACSLGAIAATTIFARWASNVLAAFKCPCATSGASEARAGAVTGAQSVTFQTRQRSAEFGRPNMEKLIDAAVAEVQAAPPSAAPSVTAGLYVCVCGPEAMVKSCKDAVRHARKHHRGVPIGLHVEEPDW